jgi:hypothetical protein
MYNVIEAEAEYGLRKCLVELRSRVHLLCPAAADARSVRCTADTGGWRMGLRSKSAMPAKIIMVIIAASCNFL